MKKVLMSLIIAFSSLNSTYSQNGDYEAILYIDQGCNWYNATAGMYVDLFCLIPNATSPAACITATVTRVVCSANKVAKIWVTGDNKAIAELAGETVVEVVKAASSNKILHVSISSVEKGYSILKLIGDYKTKNSNNNSGGYHYDYQGNGGNTNNNRITKGPIDKTKDKKNGGKFPCYCTNPPTPHSHEHQEDCPCWKGNR